MKEFSNDVSAMQEVSKGNLKAYRYLFDNHFSDLCNFLMLYLHNREVSEEIALDIFTFIWEKREQIEIKSSFKAFLITTAKYKAISQYRKDQKAVFKELGLVELNLPDPAVNEKHMESAELFSLIQKAIDDLPEKSRQIYRMAWEDNLSQKDIAEQLGLSRKTVENHVGIALRKLRESLRPYYKQIFILWLSSTFIS